MKFFLVNSARFTLKSNGICTVDVYPRLQSPYNPNDLYANANGFDPSKVQNPAFCIELFNSFRNRAQNSELKIRFIPPPNSVVKKLKKKDGSSSASDQNWGLVGIPPCNVTEALMDVFGEDVDIVLHITDLYDDDEDHRFSNEEVYLRMPLRKGGTYACEDHKLPTNMYELWYYLRDSQMYEREDFSGSDGGISGNISVSVVAKRFLIDYNISSTAVQPDPSDKMAINKKILQEELCSDLVIMPGSGNPVKCHKTFLAAHSPVFQAMLQQSNVHAQIQTLEMKDMCEESVRALLAFLYYWDTTKADSKSVVAWNLLNAGRKYEIPLLETAMKKVVLSKKDKWFNDVDVVLKLWLFEGNLGQLKIKAVDILKANFSLSIMEASTTFQQLVKDDPEASLELRKLFDEDQ